VFLNYHRYSPALQDLSITRKYSQQYENQWLPQKQGVNLVTDLLKKDSFKKKQRNTLLAKFR
jgi:hypothetical protein